MPLSRLTLGSTKKNRDHLFHDYTSLIYTPFKRIIDNRHTVHQKENRHMDHAMIQSNLTTTRPCMCRELPSVAYV